MGLRLSHYFLIITPLISVLSLSCVPKKPPLVAIQPGYNLYIPLKEFKPDIHKPAKEPETKAEAAPSPEVLEKSLEYESKGTRDFYLAFQKKPIVLNSVTKEKEIIEPLPPPPSEVEKPAPRKLNYYIVRKRDTLFTIAKKLLGNGRRWPELFVRNKKSNWRKDPDFLEVGMKIYYRDLLPKAKRQ